MLFENYVRDRSVSVTEFTRLVKLTIENEPLFANVWIQGEISNFARATSGHLYFTIKDQGAALPCVMWKGSAQRIQGVNLRDGVSLQVHGSLTVYEVQGKYQLVVDQVKVGGEGDLYAEFARLKAKLESEGLFDQDRKRSLPPIIRNIGVVTSETAAAYQDILNTLRRRLPLVSVTLSPTLVQGNDAPASIVRAIELLDKQTDLDVIILARGGGSVEDLWSFNDERVVRAIAATKTPTITGVGHEIDFTLVDFASDVRAPTPTAAAEIATPITADILREDVLSVFGEISTCLSDLIEDQTNLLERTKGRIGYLSPSRKLETNVQKVDGLSLRIEQAGKNILNLHTSELKGVQKRLQSIDPRGILRRGYAIVQHRDSKKVVKLVEQVNTGSEVDVFLSNGKLGVLVQEISQEIQ